MDFFPGYFNIGAFICWCCCYQCIKNCLCFGAVLLTQNTHIRDNPAAFNFFRLIILDINRHGRAALLCMGIQVIISPVCNTNRFNPAKSR